MRPRPALAVAVGALALTLCCIPIIARARWPRPRQILHFPWVTGVPLSTGALFMALAALWVGLAAIASTAWGPHHGGIRRRTVLVGLVAAATLLGGWLGLYYAATPDLILLSAPVWVALAALAGALATAGSPVGMLRRLLSIVLVSYPLVVFQQLGLSLGADGGFVELFLAGLAFGLLFALLPLDEVQLPRFRGTAP